MSRFCAGRLLCLHPIPVLLNCINLKCKDLMTERPVLCRTTVHLWFAEDAKPLYNSIWMCFITQTPKNAHYRWLKYSNLRFKTGFGFLLTWVLLVSQTVRLCSHWACIPVSDSLGWKGVSSEPMEDERFMLVYSVSSSCTSFRSHQCILKTRSVAQVTSFLPSVLQNVSRLQQHSKRNTGKPKKLNQNQGC